MINSFVINCGIELMWIENYIAIYQTQDGKEIVSHLTRNIYHCMRIKISKSNDMTSYRC